MTKPASQLTISDKLIRFGHVLAIKSVELASHPLSTQKVIRVTHEKGVVNFSPEFPVEVSK